MSAIRAFIREVKRQWDLLERASDHDSTAESLLRDDRREARRSEHRANHLWLGDREITKYPRIWTRHDKRRIEARYAERPAVVPGLPSVDDSEPQPLTRIERIIGRFVSRYAGVIAWQGESEGAQNIEKARNSALAEARASGDGLPEQVRSMAQAHYQLVRYFWETDDDRRYGEGVHWEDVERHWEDAFTALDRDAPPDPFDNPDNWTGPLPPAEWCKRFDMSPSKFANYRDQKLIRCHAPTSTKEVWIHPDDVKKYTPPA